MTRGTRINPAVRKALDETTMTDPQLIATWMSYHGYRGPSLRPARLVREMERRGLEVRRYTDAELRAMCK
jgi:hypothetical protein